MVKLKDALSSLLGLLLIEVTLSFAAGMDRHLITPDTGDGKTRKGK